LHFKWVDLVYLYELQGGHYHHYPLLLEGLYPGAKHIVNLGLETVDDLTLWGFAKNHLHSTWKLYNDSYSKPIFA